MSEEIARFSFSGPMIEWRGPAPYYFLAIPDEHAGEIHFAARLASYGWGCIPVAAQIDGQAFRTSLIPRLGSYLLPLKIDVRRNLTVALGSLVTATIVIRSRA